MSAQNNVAQLSDDRDFKENSADYGLFMSQFFRTQQVVHTYSQMVEGRWKLHIPFNFCACMQITGGSTHPATSPGSHTTALQVTEGQPGSRINMEAQRLPLLFQTETHCSCILLSRCKRCGGGFTPYTRSSLLAAIFTQLGSLATC